MTIEDAQRIYENLLESDRRTIAISAIALVGCWVAENEITDDTAKLSAAEAASQDALEFFEDTVIAACGATLEIAA